MKSKPLTPSETETLKMFDGLFGVPPNDDALLIEVEGALIAIANAYENEVMRVETGRYFRTLKEELQ